jgi:hypothetical protein
MELVIKASVDLYYENLPTSYKIVVIIPNKYSAETSRDIIVIYRNPKGNRGRQL